MALQRIGRTPPPAILSRPEDALAAIRGSILAGAVLPDHPRRGGGARRRSRRADAAHRPDRGRARLAAHALRLARRRAGAHRSSGRGQAGAGRADRGGAEGRARQGGGTRRRRRRTCSRSFRSLESEVAAAAQAAAEAKEAARNTARADRDEAARRLADTSRIAPAVHFADAKGLLPLAGLRAKSFSASAIPTASAARRRACRSRRGPEPRCLRRPTAGWSMPGRSAPTVRC